MTHQHHPATASLRRTLRAAALTGAIAAAPGVQAALVDGSAGCSTSVLHTFQGSTQADCTGVASLAQTLPGAFPFARGVLFSNAASSGLAGSTATSGYGLQADFGLLRVGAEAHTASTFSDLTLAAAPAALGSAAGRFLDRLTVESDTLARGTSVRVRVSGTVDADVSAVRVGGSAGARVIANLLIGAPAGPLGDVFCAGTGLGSSCDVVWEGGSIPYAYEFDIEVGRAFDLSFVLTAVASASGQAGQTLRSVRSDAEALAMNSLYAFADPVGTGFTLRAESGHDWRTKGVGAVPEPGALALSLTALAGALLCAPSRARATRQIARRRRTVGPALPAALIGVALGGRARAWAAAVALALCGTVQAALITTGAPTTAVPATLSDPLATLVDPLPADRFLLPIEVLGASGLQDWTFDLTFDAAVVAPLDIGGLTQGLYQAAFSAADPTLSEITSSGLALPGRLVGIAGFSWGASGDGTLAYVLFEYRAGQLGNDPGFDVAEPPAGQVPEPGSMLLLATALLVLGAVRSGAAGSVTQGRTR